MMSKFNIGDKVRSYSELHKMKVIGTIKKIGEVILEVDVEVDEHNIKHLPYNLPIGHQIREIFYVADAEHVILLKPNKEFTSLWDKAVDDE